MTDRLKDKVAIITGSDSGNMRRRAGGKGKIIARPAVCLASADADYVSGQSFTIDGGLSMNTGQGA